MKRLSELEAKRIPKNADKLIECYKSLACAVIAEAFTEVRKGNQGDRIDATAFIKTNRLDVFIQSYSLDLEPDAVRRGLVTKVLKLRRGR